MEVDEYIGKLTRIRDLIYSLIDELWECKENREAFDDKKYKLQKQVIDDILNGYEEELKEL